MIIDKDTINEIIINKSKFITYVYKVKSEIEINNYLNNLKSKYKDATHICYAYILPNKEKYNDDSEPQGTAGIPILDVLKKNKLNYVVCFTIRYYGGIKLGSGGLIRAYSNSCSLALKKTNIIKFERLFKLIIEIDYKDNKLIDNLIDNKNIIKKEFDEKIIYTVIINQDLKDKLDNYNINYQILDNNYF